MMNAHLGLAFVGLCLLGVPSPSAIQAQEPFHPRQVIPEPLPPITEFPVVPAEEADETLDDAELVLGVVVEGEARAYPINMLTGPRREILNDSLGDRAIAATW